MLAVEVKSGTLLPRTTFRVSTISLLKSPRPITPRQFKKRMVCGGDSSQKRRDGTLQGMVRHRHVFRCVESN